MEDRLNRLKQSMDRTTFAPLNFSAQHRQSIHEKIQREEEKEEDILLAVMQLLAQEKTGYKLSKDLRRRGIRRFEDNEDFLYILLHRLERNGSLHSFWDESEVKRYLLNDKGRKLLQKAEEKQSKKRFVLKELLEG